MLFDPAPFEAVATWVRLHPVFAAFVFWPILTATITVLLKPRTPQEYATIASRSPSWLWPRVAAGLQLVGALGLDPVKVLKVLAKIIRGTGAPVVLAVACVFGASACGPSTEAQYTLALGRCVDQSETRAESRACRALVDAQFRVHGDAGDGGR